METWGEGHGVLKAFREAEVGIRQGPARNGIRSIQVIGVSSKWIRKLMAQSSKIERTKETSQCLQWSTKSNLWTIWTSPPQQLPKARRGKRTRLSQGNFKWSKSAGKLPPARRQAPVCEGWWWLFAISKELTHPTGESWGSGLFSWQIQRIRSQHWKHTAA